MVQSARVQKVVIGDDVTLSHQIMEDTAFDAEVARSPVLLNTGDTVKCFYPLSSDFGADQIGYDADVVGALPSSKITVDIPGYIAPVVSPSPIPQRGTSTFKVQLGSTVRIEITRSGGAKETHYIYNEVDVVERGFPELPQSLNLT